jgi:hypothetical protein
VHSQQAANQNHCERASAAGSSCCLPAGGRGRSKKQRQLLRANASLGAVGRGDRDPATGVLLEATAAADAGERGIRARWKAPPAAAAGPVEATAQAAAAAAGDDDDDDNEGGLGLVCARIPHQPAAYITGWRWLWWCVIHRGGSALPSGASCSSAAPPHTLASVIAATADQGCGLQFRGGRRRRRWRERW